MTAADSSRIQDPSVSGQAFRAALGRVSRLFRRLEYRLENKRLIEEANRWTREAG